MIVVVDEQGSARGGCVFRFEREGVCATPLSPTDLGDWLRSAGDADLLAIEAFLLGPCRGRHALAGLVKGRSSAPVIAVSENRSLDETLALFAAGVDDVVGKPVHVREIMARISAIRTRSKGPAGETGGSDLRIFWDGRDPEVAGEALPLPRRERRILEFLAANRGRRMTKTQIFNFVYGVFSEDVDETVIECHMSKLRKRLRSHLGYDPIESRRHLGYRLMDIRTGVARGLATQN